MDKPLGIYVDTAGIQWLEYENANGAYCIREYRGEPPGLEPPVAETIAGHDQRVRQQQAAEESAEIQAAGLFSASFGCWPEVRNPDWIIENVVARQAITGVYGKSGVGKGYWTIAEIIAPALRAGIPVMHFALEDYFRIGARIEAWQRQYGIELVEDRYGSAYGIEFALTLESTLSVIRICELNGHVGGILIFDTLRMCLPPGVEEDSSTAMVEQMKHLRFIAESLNAAVVYVHHIGHNANNRQRGSSVLRDCPDTLWRIAEENGVVRAINDKQRFAERAKDRGYTRNSIDLGDGDEAIWECALVRDDEAIGGGQSLAERILEAAPDEPVKSSVLASLVGTKNDNQGFRSALKWLVNKGHMERTGSGPATAYQRVERG